MPRVLLACGSAGHLECEPAIPAFLPMPLTTHLCCKAQHSFYSCPPVHRHFCGSLPPLLPWAFSLTPQIPGLVSLFLGLPEHGTLPSLTAFVCWISVSHLYPTTKTQMLREKNSCSAPRASVALLCMPVALCCSGFCHKNE